MSGEQNKRVIAPDLEARRADVEAAIAIARESADYGPTGFGAVVTTGDGKVMVLRAPSQAAELVAPVDLLQSFGDGERADVIVRGHFAQAELKKSRQS